MSINFADYSSYYDLLYADKDYDAEVNYLQVLIKEHASAPVTSLLELGCGTGIHACKLASQGVNVHGVDLSSEMLERALERAKLSNFSAPQLLFSQGDARSFRVNQSFDVVTSLFHVLSYQTSDSDLQAMLETVATHVKVGGLFIFDFWYGPSVLWQRPAVRAKKLLSDTLEVTRLAEPVLNERENIVNVNYTVFIKNRQDNSIAEIQETHKMRYFFLPEINRLLSTHQFECVTTEEWITRKPPSIDSWGVCVVARKK